MNIAFLSHRVPFPPNKGEKIRTYYQIKHLEEAGHKIHVLSPVETCEDVENMQRLEILHCESTSTEKKPGKLALVKGLLSGQALSVVNFYTKRLQICFDKLLEQESIDAVICTSSSMAEYIFQSGTLASTTCKPYLLMDFMDLDSDKWSQYADLKSFPLSTIYKREARLVAAYEAKVHSIFDKGLFISQAEVDLFYQQNYRSDKIHVVGNGIDTDFFRPRKAIKKRDINAPVLLFTGVMDYLPNEDAVCWFVDEAWQALRKSFPSAQFFIAGMNPSSRVQSLEQYEGVHVTGFVDDIRKYYDQADIFIAPFRLARGVQNKVLQAFACALPTITTSLGCEGIECTNNKDVLIANTIEEMLDSIERLVNDSDFAVQLGVNSLALVKEQFSWNARLAQLDCILSERGERVETGD